MKSLIFFTMLVTGTLQAQIKNLVFEGAGIRGIAYSGAIKILEEKKLLQNVERVGGTSAGAITALLLSLGYNANEISELINSTSFKKFNDGKFLLFGGIHRLKKYYGWYRGKRFENWLDKVIQVKTGNSEISFKELHEKGYKDLFITGTSINMQRLFVFSEETFPQMKIKDAVRISMSIPIYFEAIFMNNAGNVIKHPKNKLGLHVMVDGGILANYPIRLFDSTKYFINTTPNMPVINHQTLGFKIEREEQIKNDSSSLGLAEFPIKKFNDYLRAFYTITIENLNRQNFNEKDWERTVSISDGNISPRIKKLPAKAIDLLIKNGGEATEQYFSRLSLKN